MSQKKQAITLVEVLVSIFLIAVVITAVLKIQTNNITSIEKFKNTSLYNSYISLVCKTDKQNNRDKNIYLYDVANFDDDTIRKEFKEIKIIIKDEKDKDLLLPKNDYLKVAHIQKTTYTIENKIKKIFYTFSLNSVKK